MQEDAPADAMLRVEEGRGPRDVAQRRSGIVSMAAKGRGWLLETKRLGGLLRRRCAVAANQGDCESFLRFAIHKSHRAAVCAQALIRVQMREVVPVGVGLAHDAAFSEEAILSDEDVPGLLHPDEEVEHALAEEASPQHEHPVCARKGKVNPHGLLTHRVRKPLVHGKRTALGRVVDVDIVHAVPEEEEGDALNLLRVHDLKAPRVERAGDKGPAERQLRRSWSVPYVRACELERREPETQPSVLENLSADCAVTCILIGQNQNTCSCASMPHSDEPSSTIKVEWL